MSTLSYETVNGKELTKFDTYDGTEIRETARELLENDDAVDRISEGRPMTVWIKQSELHWRAPEGWQIDRVSTFLGDEHQHTSVAICIEQIDER